jgi:hypothetical protein
MELAERIELSTSPLPRECSATELRQPNLETTLCGTTLLSYRERSLPSTTLAAKNASRTKVNVRNFVSSIVCHTNSPSTANAASATIILPVPAGLMSIASCPTRKGNGAQGRIRTSVTRRVADLQSAAINHSATCAHLLLPFPTAARTPAPTAQRDPDLSGVWLALSHEGQAAQPFRLELP